VGQRAERTILVLILAIFTALGVAYSVVVPPFEASDEKWHYPMVKYVADNWTLPVQIPDVETPWRQEGSQPPLYYALAAAATFWIDTSDVDVVRHLNPHVDAGATPDGNVNLAVHDPARESFPWRGTVLAVHVVRLLSVLMGTAAVYLTYLIAREVVPNEPALALGAASIHGFTPMVVFIAGAVNNDNLVVPLSSMALLMMIRLAKPKSQIPNPKFQISNLQSQVSRDAVQDYLLLGFVLGLAALTKTSSLALTVLAALVVAVRAVRRRSWREFLIGGLCTLVPFLAVAGWWFLRNLRLYGDLSGLNVFTEILGTRDVPADLAQLWRERYSFAAGYWGNFGGINVPMPAWAYTTLNALAIIAALGLIVLLLRHLLRHASFVICHLSFVICCLWGLGVLVPWALWARVTWSSQGRLIFSAIPVWSLLLTLGLVGWLSRRWGRWAVAAFALFLLGLAAAAPFAWIAPAYALPEPLTDAQVAMIPHRVEIGGSTESAVDFSESNGVMQLLGYDLETEAVRPGGQVHVTLYWEALSPADRDYTVFVHLLGEGELLVAQRDTYPGLGLLSTTWLEPGFRWADRYALQVPETAYAPDVAQIEVGVYDAATGVRLAATGSTGELLGDNVRFGRVAVRPAPGDIPNPIAVNFGDRMALVGYDLSERVAQPGDEVALTLYWRALRQMDVNYTVSAQLVDAGMRKAAQRDGWPQGGGAPTAGWEPGQTLVDPVALEVAADAPPGVYDVRVVVYVVEEGGIAHLPVIPADGRMLAEYVVLTRARVVD
jgi:4-amino-4-deoxy-L-arabinose transferase-like glycosyltransferase